MVPPSVEFNEMLNAVALQIVCGEAEQVGLGFTVISTGKDEPVHPFAVGVTVY